MGRYASCRLSLRDSSLLVPYEHRNHAAALECCPLQSSNRAFNGVTGQLHDCTADYSVALDWLG